MHDDFQDLETELKRLRPRGVSSGLQARLARDLAARAAAAPRRAYTTATTWRSWKWTAWSVAAAAAVAVAVILSRPVAPLSDHVAQSQPKPTIPSALPADIYKPVRADNVRYNTREEGGVTLADGTPARRVRSQYVDTITWTNPRTNASLRWSIPREEVRVVPVSFH
jgi:hypothetical protein